MSTLNKKRDLEKYEEDCPQLKKRKISEYDDCDITSINEHATKLTNKYACEIFECTTNNCSGSYAINTNQCDYLNRLVTGANYYLSLNNQFNDEVFRHFYTDVYKNILNDYIHVVTTHSSQLEQIHEQLMVNCDAKQCLPLQRHYSDDIRDVNKDAHFQFYRSTFDSIHHYLYHMYDVGMRTKSVINSIEFNAVYSDDEQYYSVDHEFGRRKQIIKQQQNKMGMLMNRFHDSNKYNIQCGVNTDGEELTFIDSLHEHVAAHSSVPDSNKLFTFLQNEEFDSEAIEEDILNDDSSNTQSNILKHTRNDQLFNLLQTFLKGIKFCPISFSAGIIWYYWIYYKELQNAEIDYTNINDHSGYDYKDLYLEQKYDNFKQEILTHISVVDYNDVVLMKIEQYIVTDTVKQITANNYDYYLHYGISHNKPITSDHLISLIMYCDFNQLCSEFSSTFRPLTKYECLSSIRKRNREFWWMSKLLRETVEIYGHNKRPSGRHGESGPFFCGLSTVLNIPSFSIRLCAPTSTSKSMDVSINFATSNGMIIQLNNDGHEYSDLLTMFDCSWISRYKEEDERLFIGGWEKIRIQSVRVVDQASRQWINFEVFFHAFFIFDSMINGTIMHSNYGIDIGSRDQNIIKKMVLKSFDVFDEYVVNCWKAFTKNKIQIVINMQYLNDFFSEGQINQCIVTSLGGWDSNKNLLSDVVFETFPNVKQIIIYTKDENKVDNKADAYEFSVFKFLTIISSSSSWNEIQIKAKREEIRNEYQPSWIHKLWTVLSKEIKIAYSKQGFNVSLTQEKTKLYGGLVQDCLVVEQR